MEELKQSALSELQELEPTGSISRAAVDHGLDPFRRRASDHLDHVQERLLGLRGILRRRLVVLNLSVYKNVFCKTS